MKNRPSTAFLKREKEWHERLIREEGIPIDVAVLVFFGFLFVLYILV